MSSRVRAMELNNITVPPTIAAHAAQLAEFRASTADKVAPREDRERAEAPMIAKLQEVTATFLRTQAGLVDAARADWLASTPASVQRKAAIGNPARAHSIAALVQLGGPAEAKKIAAHLAAEADAAGAWGLRMALSALPAADGHDVNAACTIALTAGTSEADTARRAVLLAKREYATAVAAVSSDPVAKLAAAHDAQLLEQDDGSSVTLSEDEIARLLGAD